MKVIYNSLFKRTSTYAVAIMASVFFFERALDVTSNTIFDSINKGKLWKDIKDKYE
ncbi:cytochrome b-c1 complex subunit 9 [Anastrepha obliqua]|uniref:cytochrome b-c1 complex subunit 9 n=1 Tax=Anastrepha ludens TaxID=28586 RepID=UPI0023B06230|nr:cytochrome b-c1 complex subunit 9 [Anastrepha ludens]XP_054740547.1 cytochrome b-c1 complex subunit 9 [Anastrepha obliqua]